jgi:murein DD-endopeptidase MepM/ murein hydrolase activator NlpD
LTFTRPRPAFRVALSLMALLAALHVVHSLVRERAPVGPTGALRVDAPTRTASGDDPAGDDRGTGQDAPGIGPVARRIHASLGRGGTLARALERLGVPPGRRHGVALALGGALDLARLPASTGLCASFDASGGIRALSVRAEPASFVRWSEGGVEIVELPVRTTVESGGGQVIQSVRQALDGLDRADELTLAFADIFQWDIDLLVEPRAGDRVRIVYEVDVLAGAPADLPAFGTAASDPGQPLRLGRVLAASFDGRLARSAAYWVDRPEGGGDYYGADGEPLRKTFLKSPLNYRRISSRFSHARRNPVTRKVVPHHGVDFAAAPGTPVVAAADGRVISAGWQGALGRTIRVRHGSEYATVYGHLQAFARGIRTGTDVRQNQVIGYVGASGRATGPHLHYTLVHRDRPVDPMRFRNPPVRTLPPELIPRLERARSAWAPLLDGDALTVAGTQPSATGLGALPRGI